MWNQYNSDMVKVETKHIDWTEVASFPRPLLGLICGVNEGKQSFVSCCGNQVVAMTPAGFRENYAGSGQAAHRDGFWHECRFAQPAGCCQRESTGEIFVCDAGNRRIRRIRDNERGTRVVDTVAGSGIRGQLNGPSDTATFGTLSGIAVDEHTGALYVSDLDSHCIRCIVDGQVTTLAGSGKAGFSDGWDCAASFNRPVGLAVDSKGRVLVADSHNNRIRRIVPVRLFQIDDVPIEKVMERLLPELPRGVRSFVIDHLGSFVETIAGHGEKSTAKEEAAVAYSYSRPGQAVKYTGTNDGPALQATLFSPEGVTVHRNSIIICDTGHNAVRILKGGTVSSHVRGIPRPTTAVWDPLSEGRKEDMFVACGVGMAKVTEYTRIEYVKKDGAAY